MITLKSLDCSVCLGKLKASFQSMPQPWKTERYWRERDNAVNKNTLMVEY